MSAIRHECPDGHEVAALVAVRCQHEGCRCEVAYEPVSVGMRLHEQLEGAVSRADALEAITQRYAIALQRIAAGHAHAAKLAGEALDGAGGQ